MASQPERWSDRIFRFVMKAFPADFRSNYGREMEQVFHEQEKEAGATPRQQAGLWWETLSGIVRAAPREHWAMLRQDLSFALRLIGKNPTFTAVVILTLGLGIGVNTAIFSAVNGILIRSLPYAGQDQLVRLKQQAPGANLDDIPFSEKEIQDYRSQSQSLSGLVEYHSMWFTLLGGDQPERVQTGVVSAGFFDLFGVRPIMGRSFLSDDETESSAPVLLLSYEYWQKKFGGDPKVLGRTFGMNGKVHRVVGILPPVPGYPEQNDVYMPTVACPFHQMMLGDRDARMMSVFARMKPGQTLQSVDADLNVIARRLEAEYPKSYEKGYRYQMALTPVMGEMTAKARPLLWLLLATAGFVLFITCANVASLTMARMVRRQREIAIRFAMGASKARIVRQVLTEGVLLAICGGLAGLLFARLSMAVLVEFATRLTPRAAEITIDWRVLAFTFLLSVLTGVAFALLPAVSSVRDLSHAAINATTTTAPHHGRFSTRNALIVFQVGICFVLLIGAGLMLRSFVKLIRVQPGFNPENVLAMRVSLDWSKYKRDKAVPNFYDPLLKRLQALPGVQYAAASSGYPLGSDSPSLNGFIIEGQTLPGSVKPETDVHITSPDYFSALGVPLLEGRIFNDHDNKDAPVVFIVTRSMAERYWPAQSALGHRLSANNGKTWGTIVGVVPDVKDYGLQKEAMPAVYIPFAQEPQLESNLVVRTAVDPMSMARQITSAIHEVDPEQPVSHIQTLEEARNLSVASPRITTMLLSLFGLLALAITIAGIAGVVGFSVSQRIREFGVRIALGATPGRIMTLVLTQGLQLVVGGLLLGIGGALALTRLMTSMLFGVPPHDVATFTGVALVFLASATAACAIPARRAVGVDPQVALRTE